MKKSAGLVVTLFACLASGATRVEAVPFLSGDIFASVASGNVNHYRADGSFLETLNIGAGGFTTGMAFDSSGNLYVTGFSTNLVAKFNSNGTLLGNFGSGYATPESIVFDNAGNAYVGNLGNGIRKYDSSGVFQNTVINTRVDWMDLAADQTTMLYTQEGTNILSVNVNTGVPGADFASGYGGGQAFALRILSDGGVLLADGANVKRFNAAGNHFQTYDITGEDSWFALNLNPDGTSFWSGNFNSSNLYEFNIASGANTQILNTGTSSGTLFGVGIFGEPTQGCTDCGNGNGDNSVIPEPGSFILLGLGMTSLLAWPRKRA
jgi:hypothetical protein